MICRNCSAEIDDNSTKCPICKKDPTKRDYDKKSGKKGPFIIILIAACLLAVCLFVGNEINKGNLNIFTTYPLTSNTSLSETSLSENQTVSSEISSESTATEITAETSKTTSTEKVTEKSSDPSMDTTAAFSWKSPTIVTQKIKNSENKTVAKCGYINAKKDELKALSTKKFTTFCQNTVANNKFKWLTIKFEDSTGLVFIGKDYSFATYCTLNEYNYIESTIGTVVLDKSGEYVYVALKEEVKETTVASTEEITEISTEDNIQPSDEDFFASTTEESTMVNEASDVVYITKSGTKYHKASCSYLSSSKVEISLAKAKEKGYAPCSRCFK